MTPRELALKLEVAASLPAGTEERFNGYGVMGLPFLSGHVLVLRRFPASSLGQGYTSVWHRSPNHTWNFYADVEPQFACTRYFGNKAFHTYITPITINWLSDFSFEVIIEKLQFYWFVQIKASPITTIFNFIGKILPAGIWKSKLFLGLMSKVAGKVLGLQKVSLSGKVPNGQDFITNPKSIYIIEKSHAKLGGEDLGMPAPLQQQASLQDFRIPQQGILAFGQVYFTPFDPLKHASAPVGETIF